jgi:hypothetical protein
VKVDTYEVDFKANTVGMSGYRWFFCLSKKKALLLRSTSDTTLAMSEVAGILIHNEILYIKYDGTKAYELAGPKSQEAYKLWLAEQILEQEVFDED